MSGGRGRSGPAGSSGSRPDPRTYDQKAHIKWNVEWLGEKDVQGDEMREWAEKLDHQTARCTWCSKAFKYNSLGKHCLLRHSKGDQHKLYADGRKGRIF